MELICILLSDIESDESYRISRHAPLNDLTDSIKKNGILSPPVLLKKETKYVIISGHRRIEAATLLGYTEIKAHIWTDFNYEAYIREAGIKMYHKSAGVIGRINTISILSFSAALNENMQKFRQMLHVPDDVDRDALEKVRKLPSVLLRFLDEKDAPLKLVLKISTFDNDIILLLVAWAEKQCRFSIFRIAIELYLDIRRDSCMMKEFTGKIEELKNMHHDEKILQIMKLIRYPSIESFAQKADDLIKRYAQHGADLTIPVYEEGKQPNVSIAIKWSDKGSSYRKALDFLQKEKIEDILSLL
jgi:hypothetical protein